jgi:hypothetical protein
MPPAGALGVVELGEALGVSRTRAAQLGRTLVQPDGSYRGRAWWSRETVAKLVDLRAAPARLSAATAERLPRRRVRT